MHVVDEIRLLHDIHPVQELLLDHPSHRPVVLPVPPDLSQSNSGSLAQFCKECLLEPAVDVL